MLHLSTLNRVCFLLFLFHPSSSSAPLVRFRCFRFLPPFEVFPLPILSSPLPFVASCPFCLCFPFCTVILIISSMRWFHVRATLPSLDFVRRSSSMLSIHRILLSTLTVSRVSWFFLLMVGIVSSRLIRKSAPCLRFSVDHSHGVLCSPTFDVLVPYYGVRNSIHAVHGI